MNLEFQFQSIVRNLVLGSQGDMGCTKFTDVRHSSYRKTYYSKCHFSYKLPANKINRITLNSDYKEVKLQIKIYVY